MPIRQFALAAHFDKHAAEAAALIEHTDRLRVQVAANRAALAEQRAQALAALSRVYLTDLDPSALQRAEQLTGFRGFTRRDPLKALAHELATLQKTVARIQADERYRRRQFLVGEHGELTREHAERASLLAPWVEECERFELVEGFDELLETRYDTPDFDVSFFSARYWKLWTAGDRVCETLGMADFGDDVLPAYAKVVAERLKWMKQVHEIQERIDDVHSLVQQHDTALARQPLLPQEILDTCWAALGEHLAHADAALLEQWLGEPPDRALLIALRRSAGLAAKDDALEDIHAGLAAQITGLEVRLEKFRRKATKYRRTKYRNTSFPDSAMDHKFGAKTLKIRKNLEKTDVLVVRLMGYDDYGRFPLSNDPELWWFEFTRKRPPRHSVRLHRWYDQHPNRAPVLDVEEREQRAVAEALASQSNTEDEGYIS